MKTNYNGRVVLLVLTILLASCASPPPLPEPTFQEFVQYADHARPTGGAIFSTYGGIAFLENQRARRVGDIIIVQLAERTDAKKESGTNIAKTNATTITNPVLAGRTRTFDNGTSNLEFDLDSDHSFAGKSDATQSNQLNGTIAVTVKSVLPGGNLVIEGEKWVTINSGQEFIKVRGVVRQIDVTSTNVIPSTIIANAEIVYSGKGAAADSNRMGWLSRFFIGQAWPF